MVMTMMQNRDPEGEHRTDGKETIRPQPERYSRSSLHTDEADTFYKLHSIDKEMATRSSTPAWEIPWTEELGRL